MNEGVGSTTIIVIIAVFIAAYNVNYTKAFRMKNKIVSLYEEYDGDCNSECMDRIHEYANSIGYNPYGSLNCDSTDIKPLGLDGSPTEKSGLYCEYRIQVQKSNDGDVYPDNNHKEQYYYRILTRIDIQIPIVQNVFDLRILNITGDTKIFEK